MGGRGREGQSGDRVDCEIGRFGERDQKAAAAI